MDENQALLKANDNVSKAEKALKKWSFFSSSNKFQDAANFYTQAANHFKMAKKDELCAQMFEKAGFCCEKADDRYFASDHYVSAAKAYLKSKDLEKTKELYSKAIRLRKEINNYSMAAKLLKEIGEIANNNCDYEEAQRDFEEAANYYEEENQPSTGNAVRTLSAECLVKLKKFDKAMETFENIGNYMTHNKLLRWSAKNSFFNAILCLMSITGKNCEEARKALVRYGGICREFESSREYSFANRLIEALESGDKETFTTVMYEADEKLNLDDWKLNVLVGIKKELDGAESAKNFEQEPDFT